MGSFMLSRARRSCDGWQEAIAEFVEIYSMRLVTVFAPETSAAIFGGPVKVSPRLCRIPVGRC